MSHRYLNVGAIIAVLFFHLPDNIVVEFLFFRDQTAHRYMHKVTCNLGWDNLVRLSLLFIPIASVLRYIRNYIITAGYHITSSRAEIDSTRTSIAHIPVINPETIEIPRVTTSASNWNPACWYSVRPSPGKIPSICFRISTSFSPELGTRAGKICQQTRKCRLFTNIIEAIKT